ncbi:MAG: GTP 3',8-cyclase MoaA [Verrucomicrobiales bacterium]
MPSLDQLRRPLRDLRISLTDRCNLRCSYCMPAEVFGRDHRFLPKQQLLGFEEIERLARLFQELGTRKFRLTGGEPLLRTGLPALIERLAGLRPDDLALTTNGLLLPKLARPLKAAGLRRLTVSLDALDPAIFSRQSGSSFTPRQVLRGIEAALEAGLKLKINTVIQRGANESELIPIAKLARSLGVPVRFIEFMDVGTTNHWQRENVVPSATLLARLQEHFELVKIPQADLSETARRYRHQDLPLRSSAEIGFISSVTEPFCRDCSRARLSADGKLFTCLFASTGHDLRALLRLGASDEVIRETIAGLWQERDDRYSEQRGQTPARPKAEMSYLGG